MLPYDATRLPDDAVLPYGWQNVGKASWLLTSILESDSDHSLLPDCLIMHAVKRDSTNRLWSHACRSADTVSSVSLHTAANQHHGQGVHQTGCRSRASPYLGIVLMVQPPPPALCGRYVLSEARGTTLPPQSCVQAVCSSPRSRSAYGMFEGWSWCFADGTLRVPATM